MTTLVTGGAGYIGSHMVLALLDAGRDVVVVDDLSTGFRSAVPAGVPLVVADIADAGEIRRAIRTHGASELVHFAARTVVPDSVRDPLAYYEANTVKTRALVATAIEAGIERIVFSSTAAVYGEQPSFQADEAARLNPVNPYGRSKLMCEWIIADAARAHDIGYAILRYFNVAGADPAGRAGQSTRNATHLIKAACQAALGQRPYLDVYGNDYPTPDGTGVRDFIQVSDLAAAHLAALDHLAAGGHDLTLNCGYGSGFSVLDVAAAITRVSGLEVPLRFLPRREGDLAALIADSSLLKRTLDWRPAFADLDAIVLQALTWERRLAPARREIAADHLVPAERGEASLPLGA